MTLTSSANTETKLERGESGPAELDRQTDVCLLRFGAREAKRKWVQILHSLSEFRHKASVGFTVSSRSGNSQCRHHRAPGPLGPLPFLTAPWLWASCGWELCVARAPLVRGEELLLGLKAGPVGARPSEGCRGLEAERPALVRLYP